MLTACSTPKSHLELADANKDNRLDRDEFRVGLVNDRFDKLDTNNNGKLTFHEWKASGPSADQADFAMRDTNRDGAITRDEADASARQLGTSDLLFRHVDTDGDGFIGGPEAEVYARKTLNTPGLR